MKISLQKAGQVVKKNGCQEIEFRLEKLNLWDKLKSQTCEESLIEEVIATSRATIFRWKKLLKEYGCEGLESASRRPDRVRQAVKQKQLEPLVFKLRQKYPLFGKQMKVVVVLQQNRNSK